MRILGPHKGPALFLERPQVVEHRGTTHADHFGKVLHLLSRIHRDQLAQGDSGDLGKAAVGLLPEELLCVVVAEGNNHAWPVILETSSASGRRISRGALLNLAAGARGVEKFRANKAA